MRAVPVEGLGARIGSGARGVRLRPAAAVALVLALAIAGGIAGVTALRSGGTEASPPAPPGLALLGGKPLQQAQCAQWIGASASQREAVLTALGAVVGGASTTGGRGTTLSGAQATAIFDGACARPLARHFLLYEMYIRAAGFKSYLPPE